MTCFSRLVKPSTFPPSPSPNTLSASPSALPVSVQTTIKAHVGDPEIIVEVSCPEQLTVDLDINGTIETLQLTQGKATLQLSTAVPGVFIIQPADRAAFAAAGEGLLSVEVLP